MAAMTSGRATTRTRPAIVCRSPSAGTCSFFAPTPLEADLEVTGTVEVKLWVSSTAA